MSSNSSLLAPDRGAHFRLNATVSGEGPTMVLIHGVAGSLRIFDPVMAALEAHFRVVRIDLLGYGHSPKPRIRYDLSTHLNALRSTLLDLEAPGPFHLVGLSMGANLALGYAARWPGEVGELVCVGLPYFSGPADARVALRVNPFTRLANEHPWTSRLYVPPLWFIGRHAGVLARFFSKIYTTEMTKDALRNSYFAFRSSLSCCMVHEDLAGLVARSGERRRLFIHGSEDKWATLETVHGAIAPYGDSRLAVVEGVEHNTVVIAPTTTAGFIIEHCCATR
jgi:pimeloyl-ACP methyl ester carboxylesterase